MKAIAPINKHVSSGHGLEWIGVAVIPAEDYFGFIAVAMWITAAIVFIILYRLAYDIVKRVIISGRGAVKMAHGLPVPCAVLIAPR